MLFKDTYLLEKAYLSISQPMKSVPSDEEELPMTPEEDMQTSIEPELEQNDNMEMDGKVGDEVPGPEMPCGCQGDCGCGKIGGHDPEAEMNPYDECEEDSMAVDNLNSVRESSMKIAQYWAQGGHLEPWQQQKLAIVMSSLAEIARALH
jgi:hypothetical protein